MSANEVMLGGAFLKATLSADATLASLAPGGVWRGLAPDGTTTPFVVYAHQSGGTDTLTANAVRVLSSPLYNVRVVGPAKDTVAVEAAAAQLDVVLGSKDGLRNVAVTGGLIASCFRESPFQQDEQTNAVLLTNIGGLYRIQVESI